MSELLICSFCDRTVESVEEMAPVTRAIVEACRDEHDSQCLYYAELNEILNELFTVQGVEG